MSIELEIRNGNESWPEVKPLLDLVWGSAAAGAASKTIRWANPDLRILLETPEDGLMCHIGLYFRVVIFNGVKMHIGGVGGVSTHPNGRKRGYASVALNAAVQTLRDRQDAQFGLLFCEPHNAAFYQARGWHPFAGEIYVEQPEGRVPFVAMAPYIFDLKRAPRRGTIDLCGLPW
jgi:GNAT superfamily N-acetyltransferase